MSNEEVNLIFKWTNQRWLFLVLLHLQFHTRSESTVQRIQSDSIIFFSIHPERNFSSEWQLSTHPKVGNTNLTIYPSKPRTSNLDPSFTSLQKGRPKHRSNFRMCVRIFYQSLSSLIAFPLAILFLLIFAYLTIVYLCDDLIKRRLIEFSLGSLTQGFP